MKIVFFGTPNYVVPILQALHREFRGKGGRTPISAVVTQPPKPAGRKKIEVFSPIDNWAYKKKIPIYFDSSDLIKKSIEGEVGILAAYGAIIPKEVIDYFPKGILNIHPSLLPAWRGASPVQATLVAGDKITGVTTIRLDENLDHGPIISQFKEEVQDQDTTNSLRDRLFERSVEAIKTLLPAYLSGKITPREQAHKNATFTYLLKKDHGLIPPEYLESAIRGQSEDVKWEIEFIKNFFLQPTPQVIERFIRAMQPWPIAWTYVQLTEKQKNSKTKKRLKILKAHLEKSKVKSQRSKVRLVLDEVQLEGKNPVSWKQFKEAYNIQF